MSGETPYCVLCGWHPGRCRCDEPSFEDFTEQNADWHANQEPEGRES